MRVPLGGLVYLDISFEMFLKLVAETHTKNAVNDEIVQILS